MSVVHRGPEYEITFAFRMFEFSGMSKFTCVALSNCFSDVMINPLVIVCVGVCPVSMYESGYRIVVSNSSEALMVCSE